MHIGELDDIVNKYNNKYHRTIKIKPADLRSSTYIDFNKENNKEGPKFKVGDHQEYQNIKTLLQMAIFQVGLKYFLWLKMSKILCRGHISLVIWKAKKL